MTATHRTIDLHAHTTASDGDQTPTQLVERAAECGLTALAVTDHDTTGGVAEAFAAGKRIGVEVIPGIELSVEFPDGQFHLLGFYIDPESPTLQARLNAVRAARADRNARIVARLEELGITIDMEEVKAEAGGEIVARPHFAKVLIRQGVVGSVKEAFDTYLGAGGLASVARVRLEPEEAIALVHAAGGVAILAHPNNLRRGPEETEAAIVAMQRQGLDGIEARYNLHTPEQTAFYLALAERHGLLTSGGSDFHGVSVKPNVRLGEVEGTQPAPASLLESLRERAQTYRAATLA